MREKYPAEVTTIQSNQPPKEEERKRKNKKWKEKKIMIQSLGFFPRNRRGNLARIPASFQRIFTASLNIQTHSNVLTPHPQTIPAKSFKNPPRILQESFKHDGRIPGFQDSILI